MKSPILYRIGTRLLLVNVFVVAVPILGIGFARFYEREMLRALEVDMVHQADIIREIVRQNPAWPANPETEALLEHTARNTRTRMRLLDPQGRLLADSHRLGPPEGEEAPVPTLLPEETPHTAAGPPRAIDVSQREEVQEAVHGRYGATTRLWENGDRLFMFVALPVVDQQDHEVLAIVYVTRSTNPVRAAMYRLRTTLLKVLAYSVAATTILSLLLATTISTPLGRLARISSRIAAGDRTQRLALERRDEIGELARALDTMARELDRRVKDVGALAANLGHELKSPLTSMRGAAELLLEGADDDPSARKKFLENILADTHRLDRIVTRLLELSRLESDTEPRVVFDFEALVREIAEASVGPAPVEVTWTASHTQLHGVRSHLAAVLVNLVDNAQHHAAAGTTVTIRVADAPEARLRVGVTNHGAPISAANLAKIWDRFFTTRGDRGGTGLGLPIVASVVAAHGGRVWVTSTEEEGTTFTFELPLS